MDLEITNLTNARVGQKFLKEIAQKTIEYLKFKKLLDISIVLVGKAKIKSLNKKYRKKNKITDVLAFDYGEIFICLPQAKKQAKELKHSLKQEIAILLIHGLLHLAGYDDESSKNYNIMLKKQNQIWEKIIS